MPFGVLVYPLVTFAGRGVIRCDIVPLSVGTVPFRVLEFSSRPFGNFGPTIKVGGYGAEEGAIRVSVLYGG